MKPYPEAAMDAYRISAEASNPHQPQLPAIKEPEGKEGRPESGMAGKGTQVGGWRRGCSEEAVTQRPKARMLAVKNHLVEFNEMVPIGSGAERPMPSYKLSRYACYLIVQNADPSKEVVALGQTYFAVQTRLQEIRQMEEYNRLSTEDENDCSLVMKWQSTTSNLQPQPKMPSYRTIGLCHFSKSRLQGLVWRFGCQGYS